MKPTTLSTDVTIIGSGAAGLGLALSLANSATQITVITKQALMAGSSPHAQGGIAAVMNQTDDFQSHIDDTLNAGAGLCDPLVVAHVVTHAPAAIQWLIDHGMQFTHENQQLHLTREGGHSQRRILHADDKTGAVIVNALAAQIYQHPNITVLTEHTAIDLIVEHGQCRGVACWDNQQESPVTVYSAITVLATGGASSVYLHTSNPDMSSGDGIAMGWRAGCTVANLEFKPIPPHLLIPPQSPFFFN